MKKVMPLIGLILIGQLFAFSVFAAQNAKVLVDSAKVYDKPQADGKVVGTVTKGVSLAVSNLPTSGFYKTRIPSGAIGWVAGSDISTSTAPEAASAQVKKKKSENRTVDQSRLLISGGLQILSNSGFPSNIPNTNSKSGYGGTIEAQFKYNELFYWGARAEYFSSSSAQAISSTNTQTLNFHTLPLMLGAMYVPINKPNFRLSFGLYGGVAMMTSLAVTQSLSGAAVTFTSTDICEYVNAQSSYGISSNMSILGEIGYRMHSASYPSTLATSLNAPAFSANFGGIVARLGVAFKI